MREVSLRSPRNPMGLETLNKKEIQMSITKCVDCERRIDIDIEEAIYGNDGQCLCEDCWDAVVDEEQIAEPKSYKIIRFFRDDDKPNKVILTGLTLEQAQNHCQDPDTSGDGWFDGYEEWDKIGDLKRNIINIAYGIRNDVLCWKWEDRNKYTCNVFSEIVKKCDASIEELETLIKEIK